MLYKTWTEQCIPTSVWYGKVTVNLVPFTLLWSSLQSITVRTIASTVQFKRIPFRTLSVHTHTKAVQLNNLSVRTVLHFPHLSSPVDSSNCTDTHPKVCNVNSTLLYNICTFWYHESSIRYAACIARSNTCTFQEAYYNRTVSPQTLQSNK